MGWALNAAGEIVEVDDDETRDPFTRPVGTAAAGGPPITATGGDDLFIGPILTIGEADRQYRLAQSNQGKAQRLYDAMIAKGEAWEIKDAMSALNDANMQVSRAWVALQKAQEVPKPNKPILPDITSGFAGKKKLPLIMPDGKIEWIDNPTYEPTGTPASVFSGASTTDRYILIPDPTQPDGFKMVDNPNYRPPQPSASAISSPASMMDAKERQAAGLFERETKYPGEQKRGQSDYDYRREQDQRTNAYNHARLAQEKMLSETQNQENWKRAQLQAQEGIFGAMGGMFPKVAAAAPLPGQEYHLGFEPGGVMSNIARMSGRGYDPNQYKIGVETFDPEDWWRRAQGMAQGVR